MTELEVLRAELDALRYDMQELRSVLCAFLVEVAANPFNAASAALAELSER